MEHQLSVQELTELRKLKLAKMKEDMKKKFLNEKLKEKELWKKKKKEMKERFLAEEAKVRQLWVKKTADMKAKFLAKELKEKRALDKNMKETKQQLLTDYFKLKAQKCMERGKISRKRSADEEKEAPIAKKKRAEMKQKCLVKEDRPRTDLKKKRAEMKQKCLVKEDRPRTDLKMKEAEEKDTRKNEKEKRLAEGGSERPSLSNKSQAEIHKINNGNAPPNAGARDSQNVKAIGGKKAAASLLLCGTHETQVSEGGEADLQEYFVGCKKNPGHEQFVPVKDFNEARLPKVYHDNGIAELIIATADLTVRVDVKKTSPKRPQFWPKTHVPYSFYNVGESGAMRAGTGVVWRVDKGAQKKEPCECLRCRQSNTPSKVCGKVRMHTSAQLVFDDLEAKHTTCRLFYDGPDSPLVTLDGWTAVKVNNAEDRCWLECVTCNVALLNKLEKMVKHWSVQRYKINKKYKISGDEDNLIFIVSHPHGCPKGVSVGRLVNRYVMGAVRSRTRTQLVHVQAAVGHM